MPINERIAQGKGLPGLIDSIRDERSLLIRGNQESAAERYDPIVAYFANAEAGLPIYPIADQLGTG